MATRAEAQDFAVETFAARMTATGHRPFSRRSNDQARAVSLASISSVHWSTAG